MSENLPTCPVDGSLTPPDCEMLDILQISDIAQSWFPSSSIAIIAVLAALASVFIVNRGGEKVLQQISGENKRIRSRPKHRIENSLAYRQVRSWYPTLSHEELIEKLKQEGFD